MDRNFCFFIIFARQVWSLSARRAWIEIRTAEIAKTSNAESLSARRAWIEIFDYIIRPYGRIGRSPQGERG